MALFSHASSQKKDDSGSQAIPPEILSSVKVMGDAGKPKTETPSRPQAPTNLPVGSPAPSPSSPSPFLGGQAPQPISRPVSSPDPAKTAQTGPSSAPLVSPTPKPTAAPVSAQPSALPKREEKKMPVPPIAPPLKNLPPEPKSARKGTLFAVIAIIILLIAAGGGYYYWQNVQANKVAEVSAPMPTVPVIPSVPGTDTTIKTLPYALDRPNYLSLDTETAEVAGIKQSLDEVGARLVESQVTEPIEFIITDKNNNPLAFSRFAYLLGLTLEEDLLSQIDEAFSLYLSAENGRTVVGLKLKLKDAASGSALITQNEGVLPKQMAPLLYQGVATPIPDVTTFTPSPERADLKIVRYHNFSLQPNISFDYTVSGQDWYIGTSKEMFRRLLEKSE